MMAEALRRLMGRPSSTSSFYIPLLRKVKRMKRIGPPTEETAGVLEGMENRVKVYHKFWVGNQRKVRGLMRNGIEWRIHAVMITIASAALVVKGSEAVNNKQIKYYKSGNLPEGSNISEWIHNLSRRTILLRECR